MRRQFPELYRLYILFQMGWVGQLIYDPYMKPNAT